MKRKVILQGEDMVCMVRSKAQMSVSVLSIWSMASALIY